MNLIQITFCELAVAAMLTGCRATPPYHGDGRIENTSYWADGVVYTTQYTIRLASFNASTNIQREFDLGKLSSSREPRVTVCIRLKDQHSWYRFSKFNEKEMKTAGQNSWRDIDSIQSSFKYTLSNQFVTLLAQPETLLKDHNWKWGQFDSKVGPEIEVANIAHTGTDIPKGSRLKLHVSYIGDPSLTNQADFVVLWQWK